jgi:hypothetical protein
MLELAIFASDNNYSGYVEIDIMPKQLAEFGEKLIQFPFIQNIPCFEYGNKRDEFAYYLCMQAKLINDSGHSAIHISMECYASVSESASVQFYILSEAASINDLGKTLISWVSNPEEALIWQPRA